MKNTDKPTAAKSTKLNSTLDYRTVAAALLLVMLLMLVVWKPWNSAPGNKDRTITVTGDATLKAEPDEFIFSPSYRFSNENADAAIKAVTAKNDDILSHLKKLGVPGSKITTNASKWMYATYDAGTNTTPYMLMITVTATNKNLAQRVQDYLLTTSPEGAISPQAEFSTEKRKNLEGMARDKATKEARDKADQSAHNLGFKIRSVKTVNDGSGFGGGIYPLTSKGYAATDSAEGRDTSLAVQPGENTLNYSMTVTYYIR